jgi:1-acyl-sn-glycerol-3-phosphate acyltransferase
MTDGQGNFDPCPDCDEWGFDPRFLEQLKPFFDFLYSRYWRVDITGLENIPDQGRALLISNHSGQFPFDGFMIGLGILNYHPAQRFVRALYAKWFSSLPYLSILLTRLGQVLANEENALRLLEQEQLVAVFPEGYRGISKLSKERYRLSRFGRGGYVRIAIRSGAPIIPIAVVGAEETYITLVDGAWGEKLFGYPVPPITTTWPWLGPLGLLPLPTKWTIDIGEPISVENFQPNQAGDQFLISQINDQVRNTIQQMLYRRLAKRQNIFY